MNNEYDEIIGKCFPDMKGDELKVAFDAAEEIQGELKGNFREAVKKHLEDKGYSKEKVEDFMDLYNAVFAIAFSTGVAAHYIANK